MRNYVFLFLLLVVSGYGYAQEQLCAKLDTVIATDDGSLFLRLEGVKRSFYSLGGHKESTFISVIAIAKAHEMKICLEGFGPFEEVKNRQSFKIVRLN